VHEQNCLGDTGLDLLSAYVGTFDLVTLKFHTHKDQPLAALPHSVYPLASPANSPTDSAVPFGICTLVFGILRLLGKFLELSYRIRFCEGLQICLNFGSALEPSSEVSDNDIENPINSFTFKVKILSFLA
jgi:hypothetical protein